MLLRQLTARMVVPGAKAAAGMAPLLRPLAVRSASSAAAAWSPAAPKQQAAPRGQQQQVQSYTYEPVGMEAAAEIGEVDFDPAAANSGALPPLSVVCERCPSAASTLPHCPCLLCHAALAAHSRCLLVRCCSSCLNGMLGCLPPHRLTAHRPPLPSVWGCSAPDRRGGRQEGAARV